MGFNQVGDPAHPVGSREYDEPSKAQRDVDAIDLEGAPQQAAGDRLEAVFVRSGHIDKANRQAGQEDERLGAVREPEVPRSEMFKRVAWNVIDQDRNQHSAPPKINVADAVSVHYQRLGARTAPVPKKGCERAEAMLRAAKGCERAIWLWRM